MGIFWFLIQPLVLMAIFGLWVGCIVDALRCHRPWFWLIASVLMGPLIIPVYWANFWLLGRGGHGAIDALLLDRSRLASLARAAAETGTPADYRDLGEFLLSRGRPTEALAAFRQVLDVDGHDLRAQAGAAAAFLETGQPERALPHAEFVLEEDPRQGHGQARLLYAKALRDLGRPEEAMAQLERLTGETNIPEAAVVYARLLRAHNQPERARGVLLDMMGRITDLPIAELDRQRPWIRLASKELRELR